MGLTLFAANIVAAILSICLIAYYLGWLQTETRYRLSLLFPPFTCRPCFTFWVAVTLCVTLALFAAPTAVAQGWSTYWAACYAISIAGVFASLALFFYVKSKNTITE